MAQVITFEDYRPVPRYDGIPWTEVLIQEALTETGTYNTIDTIALSPVDADPSDPATRSFTTELASDTLGLWYRLIFQDATGDSQQPTAPVQNLAPAQAYASVSELARILKIRTPSAEQRDAMERVLSVAAGEINSEIDLAADVDLAAWQLALCAEVNLERAVEHWRQQEAPFGLVELAGIAGVERTARDSWERHANKLAPLKNQWGLA